MAHTTHTLALDDHWDVHLDGVGGIALAAQDIATPQNVANECRLFTNDAYIAQDDGIPHFLVELGQPAPPTSLFAAYLGIQARSVPQVAQVLGITVDAVDRETRTLTGSINFTTEDGQYVAIDI